MALAGEGAAGAPRAAWAAGGPEVGDEEYVEASLSHRALSAAELAHLRAGRTERGLALAEASC